MFLNVITDYEKYVCPMETLRDDLTAEQLRKFLYQFSYWFFSVSQSFEGFNKLIDSGEEWSCIRAMPENHVIVVGQKDDRGYVALSEKADDAFKAKVMAVLESVCM